MAFCTHCGARIPDGAKFCTSCGTPVAAATHANPAPQSRTSAQQAPQSVTPQAQPPRYNQPIPSRPVQPVQARTQGDGIVIDAPAGSTVQISNNQPRESQTRMPDTPGEVVLGGWEEFVPDGQTPKHQAPDYQAPGARASYQAGPATGQSAAPVQRNTPVQPSVASGSAQNPSKGKRLRRIIISVIISAVLLALIFNL